MGAFGLKEHYTEIEAVWGGVLRILAHANNVPGYDPEKAAHIVTLVVADDGGSASRLADALQQPRMREEFNTTVKKANTALNAAVKVARTETLARLVDLHNPALSDEERYTRANRLVRSYQRRHAEDADFKPSQEVLDAFSIINKVSYRRSVAKKAKLAT
jgi:hypothetical protein